MLHSEAEVTDPDSQQSAEEGEIVESSHRLDELKHCFKHKNVRHEEDKQCYNLPQNIKDVYFCAILLNGFDP